MIKFLNSRFIPSAHYQAFRWVAAYVALVSASGWAVVLASGVLLVSAVEASAVQECQASGCSCLFAPW